MKKVVWQYWHSQRGRCDDESRGLNEAAESQGMWMVSSSWKTQGTDTPQEAPERALDT